MLGSHIDKLTLEVGDRATYQGIGAHRKMAGGPEEGISERR